MAGENVIYSNRSHYIKRKEHSHEENNISDTDSTAARGRQDARGDGKAHPVKAQHISR